MNEWMHKIQQQRLNEKLKWSKLPSLRIYVLFQFYGFFFHLIYLFLFRFVFFFVDAFLFLNISIVLQRDHIIQMNTDWRKLIWFAHIIKTKQFCHHTDKLPIKLGAKVVRIKKNGMILKCSMYNVDTLIVIWKGVINEPRFDRIKYQKPFFFLSFLKRNFDICFQII